MSYAQLSLKTRFRLEDLQHTECSQRAIAQILGIDQATVSREYARNGGRGGYRARAAEQQARMARQRGKRATKKLLKPGMLQAYVAAKLALFWSPEQICGRLRQEKGVVLCPETIYQYLYTERREWLKYLRQKKGKYRRRRGTKKREREREEAKKKRIDTRPLVVETRERIGDWEGDTIIGGERTTGILTHVERKSGLLVAHLLKTKKAEVVRTTAVASLRGLPVHTITYDNGSEFALHDRIEQETGAEVYFAYPYHSWERGTNENTNGLLRQFFPKGMLFGTLKQRMVDQAVELINHRPRKRHGYRTPWEVFSDAVEGGM